MEREKAHVSREDSTREVEEKKKVWMPPERLPKYQIPGMHLRWVRYTLRGVTDDANVLDRVRQHYEPVRPEEVGMTDVPTMEDGKYAGTVVSGDLLLMKCPIEIAEQRTEYFRQKTHNLQVAADREFDEEDQDLMPLSRSVRTRVSVGRPAFKESD